MYFDYIRYIWLFYEKIITPRDRVPFEQSVLDTFSAFYDI
jgi:hypothetical protein